MKLGRLTDSRFHAVLAKLAAQPLPLRAAFKLKGITARVQEEGRKFEEVRQGALGRLGNKKEDGTLDVNEDNSVKLTPENLELFARELNELSLNEVEVGTLSIAELGDKVLMSAEELSILDGLLVE